MKNINKLLVLLVMVMVVFLAACGGSNDGNANSDANADTNANADANANANANNDGDSGDNGDTDSSEIYKIGILAPAVTHGWVAAVAYHAEARAEELEAEGKIEYQIHTSSEASEMTSQLDDLITWGAEAIVAFPQWEGMEVPIQRALDEGIEVINFDIAIDVDGVYRVAGDNYDMGVQGAHYVVDKIGTEGEVVMLEVPSAGSVSELRAGGFFDTIEEIAPDLNVHTYATQFTREDGLADFADILTSRNQIDAVFSLDDETSMGVLQAIDEAGRDDIQVVTGGGGSQVYFNMMPDNADIWIQSALYSPEMVKDAVDIAVNVLNGESVEADVIIPTTIVDRDNYEEFLDEESPY